MKRFFLVFFLFLCPLILGSCQDKLEWTVNIVAGNSGSSEDYVDYIKYEEIMPLFETSPLPQGGDCWGDYFFQFTAGNTIVRVYDLAIKRLIQTVKIQGSQRGFVSNCHCNTACFGTEYYDAEDFFPLIYVSTGYSANGYSGALVYRITQHDGLFYFTLMQTLKFPVEKTSWTEFVPGDEFAYLCYTSERVIYKIPMPKLKNGDHIISREDALKTYQFTPQPNWMYTSRNQDRLFYQGKILYISGVPPGEESVFVVLNLESLQRERIVDFKKNGLTTEPESIFIWQGDICVAFFDKIVKISL